ncbi:MAG: hypothetical protein Q8R83_00605, partial [Legionellaceae bacterium]|nr:hypothetical protein [Legionellaceae bacterium]
ACPRDPEILLNTKFYCTAIDRTGSRGQAAGRRNMNCEQTLSSTWLFLKASINTSSLRTK